MPDPQTETTEHLICPWCQYDLFGLPTDDNVIRCPECGNRSDLRLLRIPPEDRVKRIRGMESLPAACSGFAFFAVIFAMMGIPWLIWDRVVSRAGWTFFSLALGCGVSWALCVTGYLRRYRFVLGATRVLAAFHACLWLFVVGISFAWVGLCAITVAGGGLPESLAACVFGTTALVLGGWLYKRSRVILGNMHDQLVGRGGE